MCAMCVCVNVRIDADKDKDRDKARDKDKDKDKDKDTDKDKDKDKERQYFCEGQSEAPVPVTTENDTFSPVGAAKFKSGKAQTSSRRLFWSSPVSRQTRNHLVRNAKEREVLLKCYEVVQKEK